MLLTLPLLFSPLFADPQADSEQKTVWSVCRLLEHAQELLGRTLVVRGEFRMFHHGYLGLTAHECELPIDPFGVRDLGLSVDPASEEAKKHLTDLIKTLAAAARRGYRGRILMTVEGRVEPQVGAQGRVGVRLVHQGGTFFVALLDDPEMKKK